MIFALGSSGMDNAGLQELIEKFGTDIQGEPGFWHFEAHGVQMVCITDESHNRMRLMAPIVQLSEVDAQQLVTCMEANFDRALDARYCLQDGTLWGAFIHPLDPLSADLFESAVRQVAAVCQNFGDSYSSGELVFQGGE